MTELLRRSDMIAIGYMAFAFAVICGIIFLFGSKLDRDKPTSDVDYRDIYSKLAPKELGLQ